MITLTKSVFEIWKSWEMSHRYEYTSLSMMSSISFASSVSSTNNSMTPPKMPATTTVDANK